MNSDTSTHTVYCLKSVIAELSHFIKYKQKRHAKSPHQEELVTEAVYHIIIRFNFSDSQVISILNALNEMYEDSLGFSLEEYSLLDYHLSDCGPE